LAIRINNRIPIKQIRNEAAVNVGCGTNQLKINIDVAKKRLFRIGLTVFISSDNRLKARIRKNN
jgi:bifunctional N-acetylglucosamine-1-phosphate-uridyltransferase/glucosamine-1-phosphate-acetyltransferase GlmU-like protein